MWFRHVLRDGAFMRNALERAKRRAAPLVFTPVDMRRRVARYRDAHSRDRKAKPKTRPSRRCLAGAVMPKWGVGMSGPQNGMI